LPKFITEWGSDPENSAIHDTAFDAAHQVAVIRQILDRVDLAFTFEIKDGPNPKGSGLWGRWGILSHDLIKKPRYFSLLLLNKMAGDRLKVSGEGTWVSGFASREDQTIRVILSNYDKNQVHSENTPVSFLNLPAGEYLLRQTDLAGKAQETKEVIQEKLTKKFFLSPNSVILLELFPIK
jgi:hypothetical protein